MCAITVMEPLFDGEHATFKGAQWSVADAERGVVGKRNFLRTPP
jgi:hypothetical protein